MNEKTGKDEAANAASESATPPLFFQEVQQFRQPILWVILIAASALVMGTVLWMWLRQLFQGVSFAPDTLSNLSLIAVGALVLLCNGLVLAFFLFARLQTEVSASGLYLRFFPLQRKVRLVDLEGVERVELTNIRPFQDYGGFGIRCVGNSKAYIVHGEEGVKLHYQNGMHLLISSKQAEALYEALKTLLQGQEITV